MNSTPTASDAPSPQADKGRNLQHALTDRARIRRQFGSARALRDYATSDIHSQGDSLEVLSACIEPGCDWHMLDVATGAGHTALRFADRVAGVQLVDLTPGMLQTALSLARERGLGNVSATLADAAALPFGDDSFDLVTCRLALHHFSEPAGAVREFVRVLKPGGVLGFTDNFAVDDPEAAGYYNRYEKLRDPSHHWISLLPQLEALFTGAGLIVEQSRRLSKEMEFHEWADRQSVSPGDKERLLDMARAMPAALAPLLAPRWADDSLYFSLWEWVAIARRPLAA